MSPKKQSISMNIYDFRQNEGDSTWTLPPWGYPLGIGINPLFLEVEKRIWPVGTAFNTGGGANITLTAFHCIEEAIRHEPSLHRQLLENGELKNGTLNRANLYILRNYNTAEGVQFSFVPLEHVAGGPPADVVFCATRFQTGTLTMDNKLSFRLPQPDDLIHSIGYCDFRFPSEGIPLGDVSGFDWEREYSHTFRVIESKVGCVFTSGYANGFLQGPCFTFGGRLSGGMSGGPVFDLARNVVFGVNSATAFDADVSLASLLFPYVLSPITFGVNLTDDGAFRLNSTQNIFQMLEFGSIASDGSHEDIVYQRTDDGILTTIPFPVEYHGRLFSDLRGMQKGEPPERFDGASFVRRRRSKGEEVE